MREPRASPSLYILFALQLSLAFGLAIFGNEIAEQIDIAPGAVLFGTVMLIMLSFLGAVLLYESQERAGKGEARPNGIGGLAAGAARLVLSRIATMFPFAVVTGALIGLVCVAVAPSGTTDLAPAWEWGLWDYELTAYIVVLFTMAVVTAYKRTLVLVLTYAFGSATGISGAVVLLRPDENVIAPTILGWIMAMLAAGLVILLLAFLVRSRPVMRVGRSALHYLTREH